VLEEEGDDECWRDSRRPRSGTVWQSGGVGPVRRFSFRYDAWCGWLLGLFGSGRRVSWVDVTPDEVVVRLGIAFRGSVPRSSITSIKPWRGAVFGWGAHGWRGRWLVNGSSKGIVVLQIEPPARGRVIGFPVKLTELAISLEDPDGFCEVLGLPMELPGGES
jgi:hypothetical protein